MKENHIKILEIILVVVGIVTIVLGINVSIKLKKDIEQKKPLTKQEQEQIEKTRKIPDEVKEQKEMYKDIKSEVRIEKEINTKNKIIYTLQNISQKSYKPESLTITIYGKNKNILEVIKKEIDEELTSNIKKEYQFKTAQDPDNIDNVTMEYNK